MIDQISVIFNSWPAAFFIKGGGEIQLLESKKYLEKKGINISLYDMWNPKQDCQILHQFSSVPGVEYVVDAYKRVNSKIALSPIYWDEFLTEAYPLHFHYRSLFTKTDVLFTNSDTESELISRLFGVPKNRFVKTRNSVSETFLNQETSKNFRRIFEINDDFVLCVANIDERKNTQRLLEACEKLKIRLVCIGAIRDKDLFGKFSSSPYLTYVGQVSDTEILKSAYQSCSVFALPSMCETPGIAALEAASQGSKIVITEKGSTKEYFFDGASYVDPWCVESIRHGIHAELNKSKTDFLKNLIRDNYTWDKTAEDIIGGYLKLMNS